LSDWRAQQQLEASGKVAIGGQAKARHSLRSIEISASRIPRDQSPRYPTIDLTKCTGDQVCVRFCLHTVCRWNQATDRGVLADPYTC
jgi:hypothetical protein